MQFMHLLNIIEIEERNFNIFIFKLRKAALIVARSV